MEKMRSQEHKKKKQKKLKIVFTAVILILFTVFAIIVYLNNTNINYNDYRVVSVGEWNKSSANQYLHYKNGIVRYNKDGAEAISSNGNILWNVSYKMKDPIADVCGSYTVIGDRGDKTLYIIDGTGVANILPQIHNITDVAVAEQGVAIVATSNGIENYFDVYSMESKSAEKYIRERRTYVASDGFPLDITISPDGRKAITSYFQIVDEEVSSCITFYNFGEVGKNKIDDIVGLYKDFGTAIVPKVTFLTNDIALAIKDNGFLLYSIPEISKSIAYVDVNDKILSVAYNNQMICFVIRNTSGDDRYQVLCYNLSGNKILDFTTNTDYGKVMISGENVVFYNKLSFTIFNRKGEIMVNKSFEKNIDYIYPVNDKDRFLLVGDGYMEVIQLIESTN